MPPPHTNKHAEADLGDTPRRAVTLGGNFRSENLRPPVRRTGDMAVGLGRGYRGRGFLGGLGPSTMEVRENFFSEMRNFL